MKPDFRKELSNKNLGTPQRSSSTKANENPVAPEKPEPRETPPPAAPVPPTEHTPTVDASPVREPVENTIGEPKARPSEPPAKGYGNAQPGEEQRVAKVKVTLILPKVLILTCKDAALDANVRLSRVFADDLKALDNILSVLPEENWGAILTNLADKGKEGASKKVCVCLPHDLVVSTRKKFNAAEISFQKGILAALTKAHQV